MKISLIRFLVYGEFSSHTLTHTHRAPLTNRFNDNEKRYYGTIDKCLCLVECFDTVQNNSELFLRIWRLGTR